MLRANVGRVGTVVVIVASALAGCTSQQPDATQTPSTIPQTTSPSSTTSATSVATTTTTTSPAPQARWITVVGDRFIDSRSGSPFVPIGVNLIRKLGGTGDRLFANYDPEWVETQLDEIVALEFNTVRFFLDMCMSCTATSDGLRTDFLDNLADLLTRLEAHGLAALPTSNDVPDPGYSERLPCCEPFGGYRNSLYLSSEGHAIAIEYWTDLLEALRARGAPTHHVMAWELANEQFFLRSVPPISLADGTVTTADGGSYDLSDDTAVEDMVVNNTRAFVTSVGNAIRALDAGALVTMGFFSSEEPDAGRFAADDRWVVPRQILKESTLDFVDLHGYGGLGGTWESIGAAYGLDGSPLGYPLLLGEFGAFKNAYPEPDDAAAAVARWQAGSCEFGFGGWLVWLWGGDTDNEVVTADAHDAAVGRAISPLVRPDPCDLGPYASENLALEKPASASAEEPGYPASHVTDGSDATWWSAQDGPPQWVEIDLESGTTVGSVEILIGHVSPPGPQSHRVYVRTEGEGGRGTFVGSLDANAEQGDWITLSFDPVDDIRHVRVETVLLDGWVILHEIRVLAGAAR